MDITCQKFTNETLSKYRAFLFDEWPGTIEDVCNKLEVRVQYYEKTFHY